MRFTALLLLAALAGALVCAQDATTGPTQAAEVPENTQSDAPQETTKEVQETSEAVQEPNEEQEENPLKSAIKNGIEDIKDAIEEGKNNLLDRIQDGKDQIKDEINFLLRKWASFGRLFP